MMITLREVREKLEEMTVEELARELGTSPDWVRTVIETDAFEYLDRQRD